MKRSLIPALLLLAISFELPAHSHDHGELLPSPDHEHLAKIYSQTLDELQKVDLTRPSHNRPQVHLSDSDNHRWSFQSSHLFAIFRQVVELEYRQLKSACHLNDRCNADELEQQKQEALEEGRLKKFFKRRFLPKLKMMWSSFKGITIETLLKSPYGVRRYGVLYLVLTATTEVFDHLVLDPLGMQLPLCKFFQAAILSVLNEGRMLTGILTPRPPQKVPLFHRYRILKTRWRQKKAMKAHLQELYLLHAQNAELTQTKTERLKALILGANFWQDKQLHFQFYEGPTRVDLPSHFSLQSELEVFLREKRQSLPRLAMISQHNLTLEKLLEMKLDEISKKFEKRELSLKEATKKAWVLGQVGTLIDDYKTALYLSKIEQSQSLTATLHLVFEIFHQLDKENWNHELLTSKRRRAQKYLSGNHCEHLLTT